MFNTEQITNFILTNAPAFISHLIHCIIILIIFGTLYKICGQDGTIIRGIAKRLKLPDHDPITTVCSKILRGLFCILGLISLAEELGFNLGAIIASLGVGSLALALAAQDTAKNFFSTFMLLIEKPYTVGDKITAGGLTGVVQEINFRSTVIKAEKGEIVFVPNASISGAPITNFSRGK